MSQVAEKTGIGRATLYKYFVDVESILVAWHDRQVTHHLAHLTELRDRSGDASTRLHAVLEAFALSRHEHHDPDLAALVHRHEHIGHAHQQLTDLVRDLIAQAAAEGVVRDDVAPAELASYCLHAISAAASLPSRPAVQRLVRVTIAGLRPDRHEETRRATKARRRRTAR